MSGVNLDAIYQRLQSIPRYHPMSANTFADWAMEAGDIVTVKRDGTGYASPVGTMTLKWNGKQQIQISTEGSRERDSISKVSARKYARGAGGSSGIRSDRELYWEMSSEDGLVHASIHATEEYLRTDYSKKISDQNIELRGVITQTAEALTSDYTKKIGDTNTTLRGVIQQTAASLTSDYTRMIGEEDVAIRSHISQTAEQINTSIENLETGLSTRINETDSTVSLAVGKVKYSSVQNYANKTNFPTTGTAGVLYHANDTGIDYLYMPGTHSYEKAKTDEYGNANFIKAGEIAITINESGDTEAKLDAKVVYAGANTKQTLAGLELPDWMDTTEGLVAEKATIVSLNALKARVGTLETDSLMTKNLDSAISKLDIVHVKSIQAASGTNNANLSLPSVSAWNRLYIGSGQDTLDLISNGIKDAVIDLDVTLSGNTYTLKKKTILSHADWTDVKTFSRATTLQVEYGGDNTGDTATYTVTATPQGNTATGSFVVHQSKTAAYVTDPNGTVRARIDNPQYGNGWSAAYNQVLLPTASSTESSFQVKTPKLATDGGANTETYTLNGSMNNVAYVQNSAGTIVARLEHGKYDAGFDAVGNPSVTFTGLDGTTLSRVVSGKATISNKTDGTGRSTSFSLSMEKTTYTPSPSVGAKDCVVVKTSGGTVVGRIDTSTTNTVTLTSDSIGDVSYDSEGNVYAKLNGTTKVTKQITLTRGGLKNNGTMALNAYCDGTRVARKWTSFNYAKLTADHKEGSKYYYTSTSNITSSNRIVCW